MVTVEELKTQAREISDMQQSKFVSDIELVSYINQGNQDLYDIMVSSSDDHYVVEVVLEILVGESSMPLPEDFYKLRGVDYSTSQNRWTTVEKFAFSERNRYNKEDYFFYSISTTGQDERQYRIVGSEILITPKGKAPGFYRIWYVPLLEKIVDEIPVSPAINRWIQQNYEYLVVFTAIKMLSKQSKMDQVNILMVRLNELKARIIKNIRRDGSRNERIQNINPRIGRAVTGFSYGDN